MGQDPGRGIFDGLNEEQAAAVATTRGPVCILAGAGSGKTTTITRRIAHQVASGAFAAQEILAVTFTDKAAREMESRLAALGVAGARVKTFHAEARAQHGALTGAFAELLPTKAALLAPLTARLPPPHKFVSSRDVATEIEWARNRRIPPDRYLEMLGDRKPPLPPEIMAGLYGTYERRKRERGLLDFEDLLERTLELLEGGGAAAGAIRSRYRAFSVDEYQDVNLLQQSLLEAWVGERSDLCVVGDDYQSIFGFTGATSRYLVGFPARYRGCRVVRLTDNYRSTPEVLALANRLVVHFGAEPRRLRAAAPPPDGPAGPAPSVRWFPDGAEEVASIVAECRRLHAAGTPWEEMAVLYRINGRSEPLEEALAKARIPYQVAGAAFLRRPAAKSVLNLLRRASPSAPVVPAVGAALRQVGYRPGADTETRGDEATRQADLARLSELAEGYAAEGAEGGVMGFVADLRRRFAPEEEGRGVQLLTYHRSKGKEFDAVFLPRLEDKELPFALADSPEERAEERRLLYVGITRARRHLQLSWASSRDDGPRRRGAASPFLAELEAPGQAPGAGGRAALGRAPAPGKRPAEPETPLLVALKEWRRREASERSLPAYVVFHDSTLGIIARNRPATHASLLAVPGIGPAKAGAYGEAVLAIVKTFASAPDGGTEGVPDGVPDGGPDGRDG
ncbi:MAG TPA: ATP-dependent DNA helicase UvrD2 [Actinomycetota bacterium]|nr:ATP-dependent DNA helicase UvrD2 [Actinomycetota bacterium]